MATNGIPDNHYYQLSIDRQAADGLLDKFLRFYVKADVSISATESFAFPFYGELADRNIPWMDLPFYINWLKDDNVSKWLKKKWEEKAIVFNLPADITPEEKVTLCMEFLLSNKKDIIQKYMDLFLLYKSERAINALGYQFIPLENVANILSVSSEQAKRFLDYNKVPVFEVLPDESVTRVRSSDVLTALVNCRSKKDVPNINPKIVESNGNALPVKTSRKKATTSKPTPAPAKKPAAKPAPVARPVRYENDPALFDNGLENNDIQVNLKKLPGQKKAEEAELPTEAIQELTTVEQVAEVEPMTADNTAEDAEEVTEVTADEVLNDVLPELPPLEDVEDEDEVAQESQDEVQEDGQPENDEDVVEGIKANEATGEYEFPADEKGNNEFNEEIADKFKDLGYEVK